MIFEWDEAKSAKSLRERGFDFEFASGIFEGRLVVEADRRRDYGEDRVVAIGETRGLVLTLVYTVRGDAVRIISARQANRKERSRWQSSGRP